VYSGVIAYSRQHVHIRTKENTNEKHDSVHRRYCCGCQKETWRKCGGRQSEHSDVHARWPKSTVTLAVSDEICDELHDKKDESG
jgi:hypothetical protein